MFKKYGNMYEKLLATLCNSTSNGTIKLGTHIERELREYKGNKEIMVLKKEAI